MKEFTLKQVQRIVHAALRVELLQYARVRAKKIGIRNDWTADVIKDVVYDQVLASLCRPDCPLTVNATDLRRAHIYAKRHAKINIRLYIDDVPK